MVIGRMLYWLFTGAVLGFGALALASIGLLVLPLGVLLVVLGAIRLGGAGVWAAVVGFGALPAAILVWDLTTAPWACASPTGGALPNVHYLTCVDTVVGTLTDYHLLACGFGLIALAGLAWPLLHQGWGRWDRPHHAAA